MRAPTREQRAKEAAVLYTSLADIGMCFFLILFALLSHSLTLIGEASRGTLMLIVELYALLILRAVHRDRLGRFRFGIGKVEQICNLAIGAALLVGGFWVAQQVVDTLLFGEIAASPLGLAAAAVVNAVNLLINALGWFAMLAAARGDDSPIYRAQLAARTVKLTSSLVLQGTLTIAALAKDPVVAISLDGVGAAFVACIMVANGLKMTRECAPDLLDRRIPDPLRLRIEGVLAAAGLGPEEIVRVRTRRSGSIAQAEVTLAAVRHPSLADLRRRVAHVERLLEHHVREAAVSVVIDPRERPAAACPLTGPRSPEDPSPAR